MDQNKAKFFEKIKALIIVNDLQTALNRLYHLSKATYPRIHNEIIIHSSKLNQIEEDERIGLVTRVQANQEKIKIKYALLELIDEIITYQQQIFSNNPVTIQETLNPTNRGREKFLVNQRCIKKAEKRELPASLHQKIVEFLTSIPNMLDVKTLEALIYNAVLDIQLQNQINIVGSPIQSCQLLVSTLYRYGKLEDGRYALEAILISAKNYVCLEKRAYCDILIQGLKDELAKIGERV